MMRILYLPSHANKKDTLQIVLLLEFIQGGYRQSLTQYWVRDKKPFYYAENGLFCRDIICLDSFGWLTIVLRLFLIIFVPSKELEHS